MTLAKPDHLFDRAAGVLLACLFILTSSTTAAATSPNTSKVTLPHTLFSAEYSGKFDGWKVNMRRTLTRTGAHSYTLRSKASNFFASIEETSKFHLVNDSLRPQSYVYKRKVFGRKKTEILTFDWPIKRVSYVRSDKPGSETQTALKEHMLDPSSYQLVLQADMYMDAGKLDYQFVKRKRVKEYEFKVVGDENYTLGNERFKADLVRRENDDHSKRTTVWLLPALDYQLAKIEHFDDGDTYQLTLKKYTSDAEGLKTFLSKISSGKSKQALTTAKTPFLYR